jgi:hypothetical protein
VYGFAGADFCRTHDLLSAATREEADDDKWHSMQDHWHFYRFFSLEHLFTYNNKKSVLV